MGTQSVIDKWSSVFDSLSVDESKKDWLSKYAEAHSINESGITGPIAIEDQVTGTGSLSDISFPIMPIVKRVAAQTIGLDLVSVKPMAGPLNQDDIDKIEQELKRQNRDLKIDSILNGTEYKEKKGLDKGERETLLGRETSPMANLLYADYKYGINTKPGKV